MSPTSLHLDFANILRFYSPLWPWRGWRWRRRNWPLFSCIIFYLLLQLLSPLFPFSWNIACVVDAAHLYQINSSSLSTVNISVNTTRTNNHNAFANLTLPTIVPPLVTTARDKLDICKACWCSERKDSLDCRRGGQLDSLPILPSKSDRLLITEM